MSQSFLKLAREDHGAVLSERGSFQRAAQANRLISHVMVVQVGGDLEQGKKSSVFLANIKTINAVIKTKHVVGRQERRLPAVMRLASGLAGHRVFDDEDLRPPARPVVALDNFALQVFGVD